MDDILTAPIKPCQKCAKRPGTQIWTADFRNFQPWCEVCCLREQIANAEKILPQIEGWRARLKELEEEKSA